jgi:hypothetical protein
MIIIVINNDFGFLFQSYKHGWQADVYTLS